jgi:hypothetical protein
VVVPVNTILVEDKVQFRPVLGEIVLERMTVPLNALIEVTVIPEVPTVPPAFIITLVGLAVTEKSGTATL